MLVEPGGDFLHIEPTCISNEKKLAPFFRNKDLLTTYVRYNGRKRQIKLVRNDQVERMQAKV